MPRDPLSRCVLLLALWVPFAVGAADLRAQDAAPPTRLVTVSGVIHDVAGNALAHAIVAFPHPYGLSMTSTDSNGEYRIKVESTWNTIEIYPGGKDSLSGAPLVRVTGLVWEGDQEQFSYPVQGRTDLHLSVVNSSGALVHGLKALIEPAIGERESRVIQLAVCLDDRFVLPQKKVYVAPSLGAGRFNLRVLDGSGAVIPEAAGKGLTLEIPPSAQGTHLIRLNASPAERELLAKVVTGDMPGPGVDVGVFSIEDVLAAVESGALPGPAKSDAHGTACFRHLQAASYVVVAGFGNGSADAAEGRAPAWIGLVGGLDLSVENRAECRVQMPPSGQACGTLAGQVLDEAQRTPVKGASVLLWEGPAGRVLCETKRLNGTAGGPLLIPVPLSRESDLNGKFRLDALPPGAYTLLVFRDVSSSAGSICRVSIEAGRAAEISIGLPPGTPGGTIFGRVRRSRPIPAGRAPCDAVYAFSSDGKSVGRAHVDAKGDFTMSRMSVGEYSLQPTDYHSLLMCVAKSPRPASVEDGVSTNVLIEVE
ncbi:MAG: hypothetical protein HYY93_16085 [Planctomycetes bacterium]|nr:hypothetical protein [Planctomycetota bacterium]